MSRPISDGFVADFETTRDVDEFGAIRMRVWLFDICTIGEPYTHRTFPKMSRFPTLYRKTF